MGKVGTWDYWFKAPDGVDIISCSNKKDIPAGYDYVQDFRVQKPDGNIDEEFIYKGKIVHTCKNVNKQSICDKFNSVSDHSRIVHKILGVYLDEKLQKQTMIKLLKKYKKKKPELKGCKIK